MWQRRAAQLLGSWGAARKPVHSRSPGGFMASYCCWQRVWQTVWAAKCVDVGGRRQSESLVCSCGKTVITFVFSTANNSAMNKCFYNSCAGRLQVTYITAYVCVRMCVCACGLIYQTCAHICETNFFTPLLRWNRISIAFSTAAEEKCEYFWHLFVCLYSKCSLKWTVIYLAETTNATKQRNKWKTRVSIVFRQTYASA